MIGEVQLKVIALFAQAQLSNHPGIFQLHDQSINRRLIAIFESWHLSQFGQQERTVMRQHRLQQFLKRFRFAHAGLPEPFDNVINYRFRFFFGNVAIVGVLGHC